MSHYNASVPNAAADEGGEAREPTPTEAKQGQLDTVPKQKLNEFKWMRRREDEWNAIARAQHMEETKKYKILDQ